MDTQNGKRANQLASITADAELVFSRGGATYVRRTLLQWGFQCSTTSRGRHGSVAKSYLFGGALLRVTAFVRIPAWKFMAVVSAVGGTPMRKRTVFFSGLALLICALLCTVMAVSSQESSAQRARGILEATGVTGGLVVHLGCGDGVLTASLRANDSYVVHGLDTEPHNVERARKHVEKLGLYGAVSIDQLSDGPHLPYIDNLVNLIVAERPTNASTAEMVRVLCPGGVAYIRSEGTWRKTIKPWPAEIDEWTHYLHGPDNNAVANDTVIGAPRRLQWNGGPEWTRSHEVMSSVNAMVSAAGRIFYVIDEGPSASVQMPPEWKLVARDAFNGVILWKRRIPQWQTHLWPLKAGPATIPRRLVAIGDRVYVTLGLNEPVVALDAATGKTMKTYGGTEGTEEILVSDGVLFLRVNEDLKPDVFKPENEHCWTESKRAMGVIGVWKPSDKQYVAAIDARSGREVWRFDSPVARLTLTADAGSVYFHTGEHIVSLDGKTGARQWQQENVPRFTSLTTRTPPTLVSYEDVLLYEHHGRILALARGDGKVLWKSAHPPSGHVSPGDVLVIDDLVWSAGRGNEKFVGKDIHTGAVKVEFSPPDMTWFHPRCYRSKGTTRYLLASRTGIEVADVRNKTVDINHWTRGTCLYGIMPANGLIYTAPHSCACLLETKTSGFNALAPAKGLNGAQREVSDTDRLTKGPAYSSMKRTASEALSSWPMYRHDAARSGYTPISLATQLQELWTTDMNGRPASLVSAEGMVVTVTPEAHAVHALDADSGRQIWRYRCGGRIDSPPTLHRGRVLFGSHDGYVYCLRMADGRLVWKFLAATNDQRTVSRGQVESVWPVHGSVLVVEDAVYCVAGHSAFLDGGLRFYRLDVDTGQMLSVCKIDETDPRSGENIQKLQSGWCGLTMPVANPDILTSDGQRVFMRSEPFDLEGNRLRITPDLDVQRQDRPGAHLFSPVGLLDDSWHHRAYWVYGVTSVYGWHVWFEAAKHAPSGRILSFDDDKVYGFARKPQFWAQSPVIEYQMYCADKKPAPDGPTRVAETAAKHDEREWNQTQWLSRGKLHDPDELTALKYDWIKPDLPIHVRAMVLTKNALFIAGTPDVIDEVDLWHKPDDPELKRKLAEQAKAWRGERGGSLWAVSRETGDLLARLDLDVPPVFDGMIAIEGKLLLSLMDGRIVCYSADDDEGQDRASCPSVECEAAGYRRSVAAHLSSGRGTASERLNSLQMLSERDGIRDLHVEEVELDWVP